MAEKKWAVSLHSWRLRVVAYDGKDGDNSGVFIFDMQGGQSTPVFMTNDDPEQYNRLDALIKDLQAAREFALGAPSKVSTASTTVDLRPLILSLKDLTQSRSEFARCEKALAVLGGQQ